MGAVYLAERIEQFSQQVAIKILHPHLFPSDATVKLAREGQLLAALEHPGVVRLLNIGTTEAGLHYIVMDYVDGVPVDLYCDDRTLPLRSRIAILLDICAAVEHAHRHLIIHSDLKPENILVTADSKPRLLDFGVATILFGPGAPQLQSGPSNDGGHTTFYASPEQRSGERLTIASDIYSLGLLAQTLLTGLAPEPLPIGILHSSAAGLNAVKKLSALDPQSQQQIAAARQTTPAALAHALHGDLAAILNRALRLNPAERFQSAQNLHDEFERYLLGYPILTRPSSLASRAGTWILRNRLAAVLGCVFLLAVLFSIFGVIHQATEAAHKRQIAQTRLHELVRLTDLLAGELYESVHGLQGSASAQSALLTSAQQTIDKLAADDDHDHQLDLELAQEYEKLSQLELNRTPRTAEAVREATADITKESGILDHLEKAVKSNKRDPEAARLRQRLPEIIRLRNAAAANLPN
jgi:non-specific serine/threonine protein kinase/serine/threonine-protein kinase